MSAQLAHIQVALYTTRAVEYTKQRVYLWRTLANSDPVVDIHVKIWTMYTIGCVLIVLHYS